jgi:hypothetical protein
MAGGRPVVGLGLISPRKAWFDTRARNHVNASVAQLEERLAENQCAGGSIPSLGTKSPVR